MHVTHRGGQRVLNHPFSFTTHNHQLQERTNPKHNDIPFVKSQKIGRNNSPAAKSRKISCSVSTFRTTLVVNVFSTVLLIFLKRSVLCIGCGASLVLCISN